MKPNPTTPKNVDEYIAALPPETGELLERIRSVIRKAAPDAQETIKYRIPTFTLKGNLVHFAAFKKHIGFYPTPTGTEKFQKELSFYKGGKGSVRFNAAIARGQLTRGWIAERGIHGNYRNNRNRKRAHASLLHKNSRIYRQRGGGLRLGRGREQIS